MNALGHQKPIESYERFFGLNEPPFSLAPNPRFVYESASHAAALAQVAHSIERRESLVVITGEIGAGKTLLCRTVIQRIQRRTFLSVINDPQLERDDLLKQLLEDFGVISKDRRNVTQASRHELFRTLQTFLASLIPLQAHAVVVIDEAQHLQPEVLEQIRLLSNIDDARGTQLQIILVGQTDLEPLLSRPELRQFQQRVSRRFRLDPLSGDEVQLYIEHRLTVARVAPPSQLPGANELAREVAAWGIAKPAAPTFTQDAIDEVAQISGGLPRIINILCDRALEIALGLRTRTIDGTTIKSAAAAVGLATSPPVPRQDDEVALSEPVEPVVPGAATPTLSYEKPIPVAFGAPAQAVEPRPPLRWVLVGGALAITGVAVWFGLKATNSAQPERRPLAPAAAPETAAPPAQNVPPAAQPAGAATVPPAAAASRGAASPPEAPPSAAKAGAEEFEIVIASFRTEARADAVATDVTALNLQVRRRVADGWQQVLAGPFGSRADAEAARSRLDSAGLTGAQIVPLVR